MAISAVPRDGAPTLCGPVRALRELTPGAPVSLGIREWSVRVGIDDGDSLSSNLPILRGNVHPQDNWEEKQNL